MGEEEKKKVSISNFKFPSGATLPRSSVGIPRRWEGFCRGCPRAPGLPALPAHPERLLQKWSRSGCSRRGDSAGQGPHPRRGIISAGGGAARRYLARTDHLLGVRLGGSGGQGDYSAALATCKARPPRGHKRSIPAGTGRRRAPAAPPARARKIGRAHV